MSKIPLLLVIMLLAGPAVARQSLEDRLDEDAFLRGLVEAALPEVLEHYIATHPPADEVQAAQYGIAAERLRMVQAGSDRPRRQAALEQVLALRGSLIEREAAHPRRALWLADQASDFYFELLPVDAAGMTVILGVPNDAQRDRVRRVAREMDALTALAEIEIDRAILDLEATPGFRDDEALQMRRRRLASDERDRRIAFLRGIGAFLAAEVGEGSPDDRAQRREIAAASLPPLGTLLEGPLAAIARLYGGLAALRLGRIDEARSLLEQAAAVDRADRVTVFAARMGGVLVTEASEGTGAALAALEGVERDYGSADDLFYRVLVADRRFLLHRRAAEALTGSARRRAMQAACDAYLTLLASPEAVSREAMRAIVFSRLAYAVDADVPLADLSAIVTVARADRLSRAGEVSAAIALYETALARADLDDAERAAALFGLGRALHEAGRPHEAMDRFLRLARDLPGDAEAERSIEIAASIGSAALEADPRDAAARRRLRECLDVLLEGYPRLPAIERWRYVAGRTAIADGAYDDAVAILDGMPPEAAEWIDARFLRVGALRAAARAEPEGPERTRRMAGVAAEAEAAAGQVEQPLDRATGERARDLRYYLTQTLIFRAEALVEGGRPEAALAALAELPVLDEQDDAARAGVLRVRIDAYRALGRPDDARREIERLLEAAPDEAGRVIDSMLAALLTDVEALLNEGRDEEARVRAERDLVPLAEMLETWLAGAGLDPDRGVPLIFRVAQVYRLGGRYKDGLRLYDRLAARQPGMVEILSGRAECLYGLGPARDGETIALYKRIVAGGLGIGHDHFWLAQLRMLEILDRAGARTEQILPRINRLKVQDPDLGGPRYRRGFRRLINKYS